MAMSRALINLGYTTKITLTVAYKAFTTRNLVRWQMFWTEPWPVGIHGVPWRTLVNIDEFGLHLNAANKKYGSSPRGLEIRKPGNYDRGDFKLTILLAVETRDPTIPDGDIRSVSNPRVWGRVNAVAGTSAEAYRTFIKHVLKMYNAINNPAQRRTLIHYNLLSHKAPEFYEAVRDRGHRVVCLPPYRPQDGPVEFAILKNQVCCGIERHWLEASDLPTMQTLVKELIDVGISGMDATFVICG
jgi:transposase